MSKPDVVVKDMISIMLIYGLIIQMFCIFLPGDLLKQTIGLWIGIVTAIGMLRHMRDSLIEALDLGESGAKKYTQAAYMKRYLAVVVVFLAVSILGIANILTMLAGVMGLKVSAYLQPIKEKIFTKQN